MLQKHVVQVSADVEIIALQHWVTFCSFNQPLLLVEYDLNIFT